MDSTWGGVWRCRPSWRCRVYVARRQRGVILTRLHRHDEAESVARELLRDAPGDAESWALLGRVFKVRWAAGWRALGKAPALAREDALGEKGLLLEALEAYLTGFRKVPSHFYAGINALALLTLHAELTAAAGSGHAPGRALRSESAVALAGQVRAAARRTAAEVL